MSKLNGPTSPKLEHKGVLNKIASKVNPTRLFTTNTKEAIVKSGDKINLTKENHLKLPIQLEARKITENGIVTNNHKLKPSNLNSARARSRTISAPGSPKLQYNPYGIFSYHEISNIESIFGNGNGKRERELMLSNPLSNPNEFLPSMYQQSIQNLEEKYEIADKDIGFGGSATIKRVYLKNEPSKSHVFALKKFSIYSDEPQRKYYSRVASEYILTRTLHNLHAVKCYDLLQLPITLQRAWGMIMDYHEYDLFKLIKSLQWTKVPFTEKMCIFKQICFGLKYIHEQDIAHLDIKIDNVLVARNGLMKITDYGCSEVGHTERGNFRSKVCYQTKRLGTPPYQPPEVSRFKLLDTGTRPPYCPFYFDYWSLGITLFVIVMGKIPFNDAKDSDAGFQLYQKEYVRFVEANSTFTEDNSNKIPKSGVFSEPHGNDPHFIYLFWRLCDPNPKTRMTLPKLFHNKFFQNIEMCLNEKIYECNFFRHKHSKEMNFKVALGSDQEYTEQKQINHSLWDDIPTTGVISQKYNSLFTGPSSENFTDSLSHKLNNANVPATIEEDNTINLSNKNQKVHLLRQESHESYSLNNKHKESEIDFKTPHLYSLSNSLSRQVTREPDTFAYSDKNISMALFDDTDYANHETEYMIVDIKDIIVACDCKIAKHAHNMLYSYKDK